MSCVSIEVLHTVSFFSCDKRERKKVYVHGTFVGGPKRKSNDRLHLSSFKLIFNPQMQLILIFVYSVDPSVDWNGEVFRNKSMLEECREIHTPFVCC